VLILVSHWYRVRVPPSQMFFLHKMYLIHSTANWTLGMQILFYLFWGGFNSGIHPSKGDSLNNGSNFKLNTLNRIQLRRINGDFGGGKLKVEQTFTTYVSGVRKGGGPCYKTSFVEQVFIKLSTWKFVQFKVRGHPRLIVRVE